MKMIRILFTIAIVTASVSCKKTCVKAPVELPSPPCSSVWNKTFGGSDREWGWPVTTTPDGGYVVAGITLSADGDMAPGPITTGYTVFAKKVNAQGENAWVKSYPRGQEGQVTGIIPATDGGYILTGYIKPANATDAFDYDVWTMKIDETGNTVWEDTLRGSHEDGAYAVVAVPGGYIVAADSRSTDGDLPSDEHGGIWFLKYDLAGHLLWKKPSLGVVSSPVSYGYPTRMIPASDGGYIVVTYATDVNNSSTGGTMLFKIDDAANIVWQTREFQNGNFGSLEYSITATSDGGYILTGDAPGDATMTQFDVAVAKVDQAGHKVWLKLFGGSSDETGGTVVETEDKKYLIVGNTNSINGVFTGNHGNSDAFLLKLDRSGNKESIKLLGGTANDWAYNIIKGTDCGYLILGSTESNNGDVPANKGVEDVWLYKFAY